MASPFPDPAQLLRDAVACVGFYTRIPVKADATRNLAAAQWATPLAGAVVGLFAGLLLSALIALAMPAGVAAALALAGGIALTGALHEDGLADVADGFGGGHTRDDKLAIMKDSRLGTYGALALMLSLLARWSALVALAAADPAIVVACLIAAHAASRAPIPLFMAKVSAARATGLSAGIGAVPGDVAFAALAIGAVSLLPLGPAFAAASVFALAILFCFVRLLALRQIGGQTGDVLGALQQGGEIALLALAAALLA